MTVLLVIVAAGVMWVPRAAATSPDPNSTRAITKLCDEIKDKDKKFYKNNCDFNKLTTQEHMDNQAKKICDHYPKDKSVQQLCHDYDKASSNAKDQEGCSINEGTCPVCGSSNAPASGCIECGSGSNAVACSDSAAAPNSECDRDGCNWIAKYINPAVQLLSLIVGLLAVASIIFAGIQYAAAGGDPQKVAAAKNRIVKTLIAFLMYAFLYTFLQFIVPGGVFK